jgi:predicted AlkP superfamily phosphohydrolase/phosphomutase
LASALVLFYGIHLTAVFYSLIVLRQLLASRELSPGWLSVSLLAWTSAGTAAAAAALMWLNLRGFSVVLDPEAARRMAQGAAVTSGAALLLLLIAAGQYSFGRRGSWPAATLLLTVVVCSVAVPAAIRGEAARARTPASPVILSDGILPSDRSPRVILLVLDGASLDYISPAAAEGRLANFGRILDTGAVMHLTTMRPTQPAPVWTAVATGKYPPKNGVSSAATYRVGSTATRLDLLPDQCFAYALVHLGFLSETANTSEAVSARPLWDVLSGMGIPVGVVGWPLTYPAKPVRGFLISERAPLGDWAADGDLDEPGAAYPADVLLGLSAAIEHPAAELGSDTAVRATAAEPGSDSTVTTRDRVQGGVAGVLRERLNPQFFSVRYQGLDAAGHRFLRNAMPRAFGDVSEEEQRRYQSVLERYYAFIDAEVGRAMASIEGDDLLLVVSGFGMEPIAMGKRLLARALGDPDVSGTHEGAPGGFLLAYGRLVGRGNLTLGSIVDVAPTILYFLGLPVARDMDGYARTDLFTNDFTSQHPIIFIPTYER